MGDTNNTRRTLLGKIGNGLPSSPFTRSRSTREPSRSSALSVDHLVRGLTEKTNTGGPILPATSDLSRDVKVLGAERHSSYSTAGQKVEALPSPSAYDNSRVSGHVTRETVNTVGQHGQGKRETRLRLPTPVTFDLRRSETIDLQHLGTAAAAGGSTDMMHSKPLADLERATLARRSFMVLFGRRSSAKQKSDACSSAGVDGSAAVHASDTGQLNKSALFRDATRGSRAPISNARPLLRGSKNPLSEPPNSSQIEQVKGQRKLPTGLPEAPGGGQQVQTDYQPKITQPLRGLSADCTVSNDWASGVSLPSLSSSASSLALGASPAGMSPTAAAAAAVSINQVLQDKAPLLPLSIGLDRVNDVQNDKVIREDGPATQTATAAADPHRVQSNDSSQSKEGTSPAQKTIIKITQELGLFGGTRSLNGFPSLSAASVDVDVVAHLTQEVKLLKEGLLHCESVLKEEEMVHQKYEHEIRQRDSIIEALQAQLASCKCDTVCSRPLKKGSLIAESPTLHMIPAMEEEERNEEYTIIRKQF